MSWLVTGGAGHIGSHHVAQEIQRVCVRGTRVAAL